MQTGLNTASSISNSQLVPQVRSSMYYPLAVGPVIQGVPASPPQSPPGFSGGGDGSDKAAQASANPWSFTQSPVPWLIGMFIVGYLMLRYIHYA